MWKQRTLQPSLDESMIVTGSDCPVLSRITASIETGFRSSRGIQPGIRPRIHNSRSLRRERKLVSHSKMLANRQCRNGKDDGFGLTLAAFFSSSSAYGGGSTVIRACFIPHRKHRKRRATPRNSIRPTPFMAALALSVRDDPQWQHSTFRAHPKRARSPVVRTCLVDIPVGYAERNDS